MGGLRRGLLALAVVSALGAGVALTASEEAEPAGEAAAPLQLFARDDRCDTPCASLALSDEFSVDAPRARHVTFVVFAVLEAQSGPARVVVVDPSGDVRYDRVFTGAPRPVRETVQDTSSWAVEPGQWTVARTYAATMGRLDLQAYAE